MRLCGLFLALLSCSGAYAQGDTIPDTLTLLQPRSYRIDSISYEIPPVVPPADTHALGRQARLIEQLRVKYSNAPWVKEGRVPRVAIVLSGGAAKGLAHIGVLRVLEEEGIRPSIVTGTSIGAIVGGLYAAGYSGEQISDLSAETDWGQLLSRSTDQRYVSVLRKQPSGYRSFMLELDQKGVHLPLGIIEGEALWAAFHRWTWPVAGIESFDKLPRPYRACSFNLVNSQGYTFTRGSLATTMRASMAVPAVFTPVVSGDTALYVDGGVTRNFPYQEAIDLGADIVIGVYTGSESISQAQGYSLRNLLVRAMMYAGHEQSQSLKPKFDLLVEPDLQRFGASSFGQSAHIEEEGYRAADAMRPQIRALRAIVGVSPDPPAPPHGPDDTIMIAALKVHTPSVGGRELIAQNFNRKFPTPLTALDVEEEIRKIIGTQFFRRVTYNLDSANVLHLHADPRAPLTLGGSVRYDNAWGIAANIAASATPLLRVPLQLDLMLEASKQPRLELRYTQFVSLLRQALLQIGGTISYERNPIYVEQLRLTDLREALGELYAGLGYDFGGVSLLTLQGGIRWSALRTNTQYEQWFRLPQLGAIRQSHWRIALAFTRHTFDRRYLPAHGSDFRIEGAYHMGLNPTNVTAKPKNAEAAEILATRFGHQPPYWQMQARYRAVVSGWNTVFVEPTLALCLSSDTLAGQYAYRMGGRPFSIRDPRRDVPLSGLSHQQVRTPNLFLAGLGLRFRLWRELYVSMDANYAQTATTPLNLLTEWRRPARHYGGGGVTLSYLSPVGPIEAGVAWSTLSQQSVWYLSVGAEF